MRNKHACLFFFGGEGSYCSLFVFCRDWIPTTKVQTGSAYEIENNIQSNPTFKKWGIRFIHLELPTSNPPKHSGNCWKSPRPIYMVEIPNPTRLGSSTSVPFVVGSHPNIGPLGPRATAAPTPKSGDLNLGVETWGIAGMAWGWWWWFFQLLGS